MSDAIQPQAVPAPKLTAQVFVVTILSAPGTRWLVSEELFLTGLQQHLELKTRIVTTGLLPVVQITKGGAS